MAKVYFYYSAMNAGKSTTLLQASYNYMERGMQTLIFGPKLDQRFGSKTLIYSRIGLKQEAIPYDNDFDFFAYVKKQKDNMENLRCILVDEVNFLKKAHIAQLMRVAMELDVAVLCYGLRSDFLGEPFEGSMYLLAWAHELIEIKTICNCGRKATMNIRLKDGKPVKAGEKFQVGGNESYISQCMKCYMQKIPTIKDCAEKKECVMAKGE